MQQSQQAGSAFRVWGFRVQSLGLVLGIFILLRLLPLITAAGATVVVIVIIVVVYHPCVRDEPPHEFLCLPWPCCEVVSQQTYQASAGQAARALEKGLRFVEGLGFISFGQCWGFISRHSNFATQDSKRIR